MIQLDQKIEANEVKLLANCTVGIGFSYTSFQAGLESKPDLVGCDAGSSDGGPFLLGSRRSKGGLTIERDLEIMVEGALRKEVPLVIGSCGGTGANAGVEKYLALVAAILSRVDKHATVATICAEVPQSLVISKLHEQKIAPIGAWPMLREEDVQNSSAIVAMMGVEPIVSALKMGANIVLAGRCCDPAIFACVPLMSGIPPGIAWHAAKSIDKGYLATTDPTKGSSIMAYVNRDGFILEPMKEDVACTVATVARQTMHENPNPFAIIEPGGTIDTQSAVYEQLDPRRVLVSGSEFLAADPYTLKLEGASQIGYRSIVIAGIRDPRTLGDLRRFLSELRVLVDRAARSMKVIPDQYSLNLRVYGRDAVLGELEPEPELIPKEVALIIDVVAADEDTATALASRASTSGNRLDLFGGLEGGGNFAYPFSPRVIELGPVFRWSVWHTMTIDPSELPEIFPIELHRL